MRAGTAVTPKLDDACAQGAVFGDQLAHVESGAHAFDAMDFGGAIEAGAGIAGHPVTG